MMTKQQFAKMLIQGSESFNEIRYKRDGMSVDNLLPDEIDFLNNRIFAEGALAIGLEFTGLLKPENKDYAASRGGVTRYMYYDTEKNDVFSLSLREIIDLLPDEKE